MNYPSPTHRFPQQSILRRLSRVVRTLRTIAKSPQDSRGITLTPHRAVKGLAKKDIPLIVLTHDEKRLVLPFLQHYRKLGVTRFIVVDDRSEDGTTEILEKETDVDLFRSNVRYKDASRGRAWRTRLVDRYGRDRWYLNVDSDEFLVYRNSDKTSIGEVIPHLEANGIQHFPAPMLDFYPPGNVNTHTYDGNIEPWQMATHLDESGYSLRESTVNWRIEGGVRRRVFETHPQLIKYPLMYWGRYTGLRRNVHSPEPYWHNFASPMGALLHFKFFSDYEARFREVLKNAQHYQSGAVYQDMIMKLSNSKKLVLESDISFRYSGPEDLYSRGFFADWRQHR